MSYEYHKYIEYYEKIKSGKHHIVTLLKKDLTSYTKITCFKRNQNIYSYDTLLYYKECLDSLSNIYKKDLNNKVVLDTLFKHAMMVIQKTINRLYIKMERIRYLYKKYRVSLDYNPDSDEILNNLRALENEENKFDISWWNNEDWPEKIIQVIVSTIIDVDDVIGPNILQLDDSDMMILQAALPLLLLLFIKENKLNMKDVHQTFIITQAYKLWKYYKYRKA